jgi:preprotein translocase SecE subunit
MVKVQKYVNAIFIAGGALAWFLAQHYVQVLMGYFQLGRQLGPTGSDVVTHALPLLLGVAVFLGLRTNSSSHRFVTDAVGELTHVSWPSQKDVRVGVIVVVVTVAVAGVVLGVLDLGLVGLIRTLIGA